MNFTNLDQLPAFEQLKRLPKVDLKKVLNPQRIQEYTLSCLNGYIFNYAASAVDQSILESLNALQKQAEVFEKYKAVRDGQIMNTTENRMVLHHLARAPKVGKVKDSNGQDIGQFFQDQLDKMKQFTHKVHEKKLLGSTGKAFDTIVQVGIGGSDLGPRAMYLALENWARVHGFFHCQAHFISNVDPDDVNAVLAQINLETTLFVIVSKSGNTQETLTNQEFIIQEMKKKTGLSLNPCQHMVVVTSQTSPLANTDQYLESFYMNDYIGGRYSSTSVVGGVTLSLAFGFENFQSFLEGAHDMDVLSEQENMYANPALLDALIAVYQRNILNVPTLAILPYSQALIRFPAHLQQLEMESNGKSVNRDAQPINYSTGPVIWGEPGTNGQHSFYQLLHQGTDDIGLQFIGFQKSQIPEDLSIFGSSSHKKLNANLMAQIFAFALGQQDDVHLAKNFRGQHYSSLIYIQDQLTPYWLGVLLAHYENSVMFQGFLWNINSFDQEGVQLGKLLTRNILDANNTLEPSLKAYLDLIQFNSLS